MKVRVFRRSSIVAPKLFLLHGFAPWGHSCILASLKRGLTVECALGAVVLCLVPECRKDPIHCLEQQQHTTIFCRRTGRCCLLQHLCRLGLALTEDRMLKSQYKLTHLLSVLSLSLPLSPPPPSLTTNLPPPPTPPTILLLSPSTI